MTQLVPEHHFALLDSPPSSLGFSALTLLASLLLHWPPHLIVLIWLFLSYPPQGFEMSFPTQHTHSPGIFSFDSEAFNTVYRPTTLTFKTNLGLSSELLSQKPNCSWNIFTASYVEHFQERTQFSLLLGVHVRAASCFPIARSCPFHLPYPRLQIQTIGRSCPFGLQNLSQIQPSPPLPPPWPRLTQCLT